MVRKRCESSVCVKMKQESQVIQVEKVAKFYKVSFHQFLKDWKACFPNSTSVQIQNIYDEIKLPKRATKGSAGYDFYTPITFVLPPQHTIKLPTGIRVKIQEGWVLTLYPRSSLGFKYRLQLDNSVGIIDSDYFSSDNEGHLFVKLTNDTNEGKTVNLRAGDAMLQGIFLPFGICEDDVCQGVRNGGFGSTN